MRCCSSKVQCGGKTLVLSSMCVRDEKRKGLFFSPIFTIMCDTVKRHMCNVFLLLLLLFVLDFDIRTFSRKLRNWTPFIHHVILADGFDPMAWHSISYVRSADNGWLFNKISTDSGRTVITLHLKWGEKEHSYVNMISDFGVCFRGKVVRPQYLLYSRNNVITIQ